MLRFPLCKIAKGIPVCSHDSDKGLQCTLTLQYLCLKNFLPWLYILILKCAYVLQNIHTSSAFHIVEGCCCPFSNPGYAMSCLPVEPFSSASSENVHKAIIRMSVLFCDTLSQKGHLVSHMTILVPNLQITRSDIRPHIKWVVCLVIAYGHFTLPWGIVWVCMSPHTHFILPLPPPPPPQRVLMNRTSIAHQPMMAIKDCSSYCLQYSCKKNPVLHALQNVFILSKI